MLNNYDNIAGAYDFLSKLVYGDRLLRAQTCLIPFIPPTSSILIVGGGTGVILEEISKHHPHGLRIVYVEISAAMIELARKKNLYQNEVIFVNQAIESYTSNERFDIIFTPFLFDNFGKERVEKIVSQLITNLKTNGSWLFADFHLSANAPLWQRLVLKTMLRFFALICNIESRELHPMEPVFSKHNYTQFAEFYHCKKFIKSVVYKPLA